MPACLGKSQFVAIPNLFIYGIIINIISFKSVRVWITHSMITQFTRSFIMLPHQVISNSTCLNLRLYEQFL